MLWCDYCGHASLSTRVLFGYVLQPLRPHADNLQCDAARQARHVNRWALRFAVPPHNIKLALIQHRFAIRNVPPGIGRRWFAREYVRANQRRPMRSEEHTSE